MSDLQTAIALKQVKYRIGSRLMLDGITANIKFGEVTGIVGPNGAGKSTLLKLMSGEWCADGGTIFLKDQQLKKIPLKDLARKMAVLPQHNPLAFGLSVKQVVTLGRLPHLGLPFFKADMIDAALDAFDLLTLSNRPYSMLSGGEKQRTQLARVLVQAGGINAKGPYCLLLDEPTAALDPRHQRQLMTIVQVLAQRGLAVVMALHDLNAVSAFCDAVLVLSEGKLVRAGLTEAVFSSECLTDVFQTPLAVVPLQLSGQGVRRRIVI